MELWQLRRVALAHARQDFLKTLFMELVRYEECNLSRGRTSRGLNNATVTRAWVG